MRKQSILVSVLAGLTAIAGCGSTTRTRELSSGYAIFDIKAGPVVRAARIVDAIKADLQKGTTQVQIVNSIPPSPLPDTPGRFQLASPLKGSGLASFAAAGAQSLLIPTCGGAIMTANARDSSMNRYGEATTFFACLMPYRDGYALNVYTTFTKASGRVQLGGARSDVDASSHWRQRAVHPPDDRLHGRGDQADRGERQPAGGRIPDAPTAGGDLPMFRWTLNADVA